VTLIAKTASGLYNSFGSDLPNKYASDLRCFVCLQLLDIPAKLGCHPSRDVAVGTIFVIFGHFRQTVRYFCFAETPDVRLVVQYSGRLVVDSLRIVELLRIC